MANAKTGKKVIRRRREKKNVEKGQVHIRSSFNTVSYTHLTLPTKRIV